MPQRIRDYGVAAVALGVTVAALTSLDHRVPGRIAQTIKDLANGHWLAPASPIGDLVVSVSASPAVTNASVVALLAAAVVLVFLMVRT